MKRLIDNPVLRMAGTRPRWLVAAAMLLLASSGLADKAVTPENVLNRSLDIVAEAAKQFPDSPLPDYVKGGVYFRSQRYEKAVEAYKQALKLRPKSAEIQYHLAFTYSRLHRFDEAIAWYRKLIGIRPDFPKANQRLGKALFERGQVGEAIEAMKREIKYYPKSPSAHYYLGEAYWQQGEYKKAIEHARETVELDDRYPEPYYLLAKAHRNLGNRKEAKSAIESFRKAKQSETKRLDSVSHITNAESAARAAAKTHFEVGEVYQAHGSLRQAISHYEQALELDSDHVDARLRLVELYQKRGKPKRAVELARELVARRSDRPQYRMVLGMTLASNGDWEEAAKHLRRANKLAPTDRRIARRYAKVLLRRKASAEALKVMREAILDGGEARDYDLLSRIHYRRGNLKKSLAAMRKAIDRAPKNSMYQKRYRQLKQRLNQ